MRRGIKSNRVLAFAVASVVACSGVNAATLVWDADAAGPDLGGTGAWDASSARWRLTNSSGALQAYTDVVGGHLATFSGTAGTVTIDPSLTVAANRLNFTVDGYTIAGSPTSSLSLVGVKTIDVGTSMTATISASISGSVGLSKVNNGTLVLAGDNTYTGVTSITNAGVLKLGHVNAIKNSSSVSIGSEGILELNGYEVSQDVSYSGTAASNAIARVRNNSTTATRLTGAVAGSSNISALTVDGTGNIEITGNVTGNVLKTGTGTLTLSGSNSFANITSVESSNSVHWRTAFTLNNGHLALGSANALAGGGTFFINSNNSANVSTLSAAGAARTVANTVQVNVGTNASEGALVLSGKNALTFTAPVVTNRSSGSLGITVNNQALTTFSGGLSIVNGGANMSLQGSGDILVDSNVTRGTATSGIALTYNGPGALTLSASANDIASLTVGGGTVRVSGLNSLATSSLVTRSGNLVLDVESGNDRWNTAATVSLGGGSLTLEGKSSGASSQTLGNPTVQYGNARIVVDQSTGSGANLTLGNTWTRNNGGTLLVDLSSGSAATLTSSPTLSNSLISSGGAYVMVKDSGGIGFGTVAGGKVVRYTGASPLATNSNTSTTNYAVAGGLNFTDADRSINTLQIDTSASGGTLDLGTVTTTRRLTLTNRSVLMTGANNYVITNGILGATNTEAILLNQGTGKLTVSALIGNTTSNTAAVTKAGSGLVVLSGSQVYTGSITIHEGALQADEGSGLGTGNLRLMGGVLQSTGTFSRALGTASGQVRWNTNSGEHDSGGFAASTGTFKIELGGGTSALQWGATNFLQPGRALVLGSTTADGVVEFRNGIDLGPLGGQSGNTRTITVVDNANSTNDKGLISGNITSTGLNLGILKNGDGILELGGLNTYTGDTIVNGGTLRLLDNAQMKFAIGANGLGTAIRGTGALQVDGDFVFDLAGATAITAGTWRVVDVPSLSSVVFGSTFSVSGFSETTPGVWTQGSYRFTESSGILSVVPEPASVSLLGLGAVALLGRRGRGSKK